MHIVCVSVEHYLYICLISQHQRLLIVLVTAFVSWQMRGSGNKGRKRDIRRQRGMGAAAGTPSGEVTLENEVEDDSQEADDGMFDTVGSDPELREAAFGETSSSTSHVARLEAQIERLEARLNTARFETRDQNIHGGNRKSQWKADSLLLLPLDTPLMRKPGSIFGLHYSVFA